MIRTKKNLFYDEYVAKKFIAIGWNLLKKSHLEGGLSKSQEEDLKKQINESYREKVPGAALNKCMRFCCELKENDIAIIIGDKKIAVVYIKNYYEEDGKEYTVEAEKKMNNDVENSLILNVNYSCPYSKRRKIEIIKEIDKKDVSIHLLNAIGINRHSLSDLNEYAEHILCECFPWYYYDNKITFSVKVQRKKDINAIDFSEFVLASAKMLGNEETENVCIKTTINSPGNILIQIGETIVNNPLLLPTVYIAIFGGKVKGIELNSLVNIIKSFVNRKYENEMKAIEKEKQIVELNLLKQNLLEKKIENIKKAKDLQIERIEQNAEKIFVACDNLEIKSNNKVIDIFEKIQQYSEGE